MIKKIITSLITLISISCTHTIDNKEIINSAAKADNLTLKSVDVLQESNYFNVITDLEQSVKSSKEAWKNAPELNQLHRLKTIDYVSKKFLKKLNEVNYLKEDKVIAYRFIKTDKSKEFIGYAVVLFHEQNQTTLYYEIHDAANGNYPSGVKQLINRGLTEEINKIEAEYYKKHPLKLN
ncbi:hypothetical protein [Flavobacterium sp.]|uniref:hypothetical protein n=1 Tax=Flavobacterium sp. TaxID=239 RepID=UPI00286C74CD|nr:hypothetical protein [Flavobacterium sp.]